MFKCFASIAACRLPPSTTTFTQICCWKLLRNKIGNKFLILVAVAAPRSAEIKYYPPLPLPAARQIAGNNNFEKRQRSILYHQRGNVANFTSLRSSPIITFHIYIKFVSHSPNKHTKLKMETCTHTQHTHTAHTHNRAHTLTHVQLA